MKSFYFRFTPSSSSSGRWTQETAAAVGGVTGEVAGCSSARSRPRLRCTGRRGVLAAGLMTPWSGRGWPARQLPAAADRLGAEDGEARRGEAAVAGCGPAVANSGGQSSWRKEEERGRGTGRPWSAARQPWQRQVPVGRESRRREGKGEGESEWEL